MNRPRTMSTPAKVSAFRDRQTHQRLPAQASTVPRDQTLHDEQELSCRPEHGIAGSATSTPKSGTTPWKANWKMPDVGVKCSRRNIPTSVKEGDGSFRTGKIARKLGEIAVANDLAYIPRMSDDALVGINPDEKHSRDSYVEAHHAAMDFTRQLPKGTRPAFFNPSTHMLVPLQGGQRHHSAIGLRADQPKEPILDLLDLEFMANKPRTMPDIMPSAMLREGNNTRDTSTAASPLRRVARFENKQRIPDLRRWPSPRSQSTREDNQRKVEKVEVDATIMQKPLPRVPTQLRPAQRSLNSSTHILQGNNNLSDRSELFCSPLPVFQDHLNPDVTPLKQQPPNLQPLQTTFPNPPTHQTLDASNTKYRRPQFLISHNSSQPSATWNGPVKSPDQNLGVTPEPKPSTIDGFPSDHRPKTPPLSFDDVETFSPKADQCIPDFSTNVCRSNSSQRRKESKCLRRKTGVHRKKTSQEIWDEKSAANAQSTREEKEEFERKHNERLRAMKEEIEREKKARERAEFDRRHEERLKAMRDEIVADEMKVRREKQHATNRLRPIARTFQPNENEHKIRILTRKQTLPDRDPAETGKNNNNNKNTLANSEQIRHAQMRPTARTFQMDQGEHTLRARTRTYEQDHQQQNLTNSPQLQPALAQIQGRAPKDPAGEPPPFRWWQPNPNARTFEMLTGAGNVAVGKRRTSTRER